MQINIILQSEHPGEKEATHQSARHTQKHSERNNEALIKRTQNKVNHQEADTENNDRRTALLVFLTGDTSVIIAIAFRKRLFGSFLHSLDGVSRTISVGRHRIYRNGVIHIETAQRFRTVATGQRNELAQWRHLSIRHTHKSIIEGSFVQTEHRIGLNHDTVHFRETVEIGHILPTVITGQRTQHCIGRDTCTLTFSCIHLYRPLRIANVECRISHRYFRPLVQSSQVLLGGGEELVHITAHLILHVEFERITHTVTRNHTRRDGEHTGILDISRTRIYLTDHRLHIVLITRTFVPRFQFENQHTERTTLSCQQSVTGHFLHVFQLRYFYQAFFDTFHHLIRRCQRTACRRTYIHENNTLIFVGYQTGLRVIHQ